MDVETQMKNSPRLVKSQELLSDPACECGDLQSQHVDSEAQCYVCPCREFAEYDEFSVRLASDEDNAMERYRYENDPNY